MPQPFFGPNAYDPNRNINIAQGAQPTAEELGAHAVAVNLGVPASGNTTPMLGGATPQADVWTFKKTEREAPQLPFGTPQTQAGAVIAQAKAMATEDNPMTAPPMVTVPLVINGVTPEGAGIPEYNVSTPYAGGPGLNEEDVQPAQTDASGRRVLNVSGANVTGSATPPKSKTLMWVAIAALVALVVFDS